MTSIAALILAGGKGERLGGVAKAELRINGQRLIDRLGAVLDGLDPILVALGPMPQRPVALPHPMVALPPEPAATGPLGGLLAALPALSAARPDLVLMLAVDTPFFPPDFLERATALLGDAHAVCAAWHGQRYPTNVLFRTQPLLDLLQDRQRAQMLGSPRVVLSQMRTVSLDYAGLAASDPFASINTIADLLACQRRAGFPQAWAKT